MDSNNPDDWESDEFFREYKAEEKKRKLQQAVPMVDKMLEKSTSLETMGSKQAPSPSPLNDALHEKIVNAFAQNPKEMANPNAIPMPDSMFQRFRIMLVEDGILDQFLSPRLVKMLTNAYLKGFNRGRREPHNQDD